MLLAVLLVVAGLQAYAQTQDARHHDGFYFSFGLGPSFGHIDGENTYSDVEGIYHTEYSGVPFAFDLRVGGAIQTDWLLTFDIIGHSMSGPQMKTDTGTYLTAEEFSFSEYTYGAGITRFFMPYNIYAGATVGMGLFTYGTESADMENTVMYRSKGGFSWMLRAGKSWYVGRKWGLGFGVGYGSTGTKTADRNGKEDLFSRQFMATINVSYQ